MRIVFWIVIVTIVFEAVTCVFRFGLSMQSTRDTAMLAEYTFGYRIHHGYVGAVMVLILAVLPSGNALRDWGIVIGAALFFSDMIHHFLVLWPITGDPEFHIKYPGY